jgi:hypothetical protein
MKDACHLFAGGGGNIGADKASKSPADGYSLYIGNRW